MSKTGTQLSIRLERLDAFFGPNSTVCGTKGDREAYKYAIGYVVHRAQVRAKRQSRLSAGALARAANPNLAAGVSNGAARVLAAPGRLRMETCRGRISCGQAGTIG